MLFNNKLSGTIPSSFSKLSLLTQVELNVGPGAAYFDQAHNGVTVRKTILAKLLGAL